MSVKNFSLRAQLNCVIVFVLLLSFLGSVWINIFNTQHFLSKQLESHAQDTATSLGLSLSDPMLEKEKLVIEATINAIFDRGFYHHITLEDTKGGVIYKRVNDNQPEQVPTWFINLFELTAPEQKSLVDTGWTIGGILKVQSHTGFAYAQLWKSANDMSHAMLFIFVLALLFGYIVLQQVYKPINAISLQADAVQNRQFVLIEKLPRAIELRNFVVAMNQMISNIKATFEELTLAAENTRKEAYIDTQTGIANRRAFNDIVDALLAPSVNHRGHIAMVRVTGLALLNQHQGYIVGDKLLANLIKSIIKEVEGTKGFKLCRISGSELCFFVKNQRHSELQALAIKLVKQFNRHIEVCKENKIALGVVPFTYKDDFTQIMYQLDRATNNSLESSVGYYIETEQRPSGEIQESASSFKTKIEGVLATPDKSIQLKGQKSNRLSDREAFAVELFASFTYQGEQLNTGDLFATASQFDLTAELDLAILQKALTLCPNIVAENEKIAVNLSRLTFTNGEAMQKIITIIKQSSYADQLVIGLTEASVVAGVDEASDQLAQLTELGSAICINRFGSSIESLKYLMQVRPDFVKLETAYTRNIDSKENNAQLVASFVHMAHGLNIPVVAQCVETEEELATLKSLNIDSVLGYAIEKPKTISE
ncbi:MAG: EAL domain-containing protein [Alteromonadales bacterium]|nr:EAL domain-containing protein [Alteromonadales bacterium]